VVPVTRENCTIAANRTTPAVVFPKQGTPAFCDAQLSGINLFELRVDEEFMDITWHLSFSGRSPAKMAIADSIDFSGVGHNQSEYENVMAQDKAELFSMYKSFLSLSCRFIIIVQMALLVTDSTTTRIRDDVSRLSSWGQSC
jgi:hypothetical protein